MHRFRRFAVTTCCSSFLLFLSFSSCRKETPPEPPQTGTITLEAVDASCTEAWLRVTFAQSVQQRAWRLVRDGQTVLSAQSSPLDTVVVDTSLLPNRTYTYKAYQFVSNTPIDSSTSASVATMDTTSHSFQFSIDTLGVSSSDLSDVAIISENNIWAVGELYLNDSSGQLDPILYNAAHWDGTRWNIMRIPYIYQGSVTYSSIKCLFAFNAQDIWFSNSVHWNGQQFHNIDLAVSIFYGVAINKMWGSPNGELYVVGNNGTIAYSPNRGSMWQRLESGTTLHIYDIFGALDPSSGGEKILCVAANIFHMQGAKIIAVEGNTARSLASEGLAWDANGIWFVPRKRYYVVGSGIYRKRSLGDSAWVVYPPGQVTRFGSSAVRGTDVSDVFVVGSCGEVVHFNGQRWCNYSSELPMSSELASVAVRGRLAIAVGFDPSTAKAMVLRGIRQP